MFWHLDHICCSIQQLPLVLTETMDSSWESVGFPYIPTAQHLTSSVLIWQIYKFISYRHFYLVGHGFKFKTPPPPAMWLITFQNKVTNEAAVIKWDKWRRCSPGHDVKSLNPEGWPLSQHTSSNSRTHKPANKNWHLTDGWHHVITSTIWWITGDIWFDFL